ncbi:MAG TPA: four helix bundle protein [Candidatus Kapabacteria bacterium]
MAQKTNIIQDKSYAFSIRIVKLYQYLTKTKKEKVLAVQILRSGTSVGANVEEAIGAFSIKEFNSKMGISYKEARETKYWLRLLRDTGYIESKPAESMLADCEELLKIMGSILKTGRQNKASN